MNSVVLTLMALFFLAGCNTAGLLPSEPRDKGAFPVSAPQKKELPAERVYAAQGGLLVRGTEPVRGLPGFGRNAIPALAGVYLVQSREGRPPVTVKVWASREWLFFQPPQWVAESTSGGEALRVWRQELKSSEGVLRAYELKSAGPEGSRWTVLVLEPPVEQEEEASLGQFYRNLIRRFMYFADNARRVEDVSFPALVGAL